MAAVISPEQAVAYVRELSADVRAVVVLAADNTVLAGPAAVAAAAGDLLQRLGPAPAELVARSADGVVWAVATPRHTVVAAAGPLALTGPTALDVRTAAASLSGPEADNGATAPAPRPEAPDSALQRAIGAILTVI